MRTSSLKKKKRLQVVKVILKIQQFVEKIENLKLEQEETIVIHHYSS